MRALMRACQRRGTFRHFRGRDVARCSRRVRWRDSARVPTAICPAQRSRSCGRG